MSAVNADQPAGAISQEMIDAMLNGGAGSPAAVPTRDPWSTESLEDEISSARVNAGLPAREAVGVGARVAGPVDVGAFAGVGPSEGVSANANANANAGGHSGRFPAEVEIPSTTVSPVQFARLTSQPMHGPSNDIDLLMDVQMAVSVDLGRTQLSVREILALQTGSLVELDKLAGEPVDVLVHGTLVARGEVVVVDERFGVRITEILSKN